MHAFSTTHIKIVIIWVKFSKLPPDFFSNKPIPEIHHQVPDMNQSQQPRIFVKHLWEAMVYQMVSFRHASKFWVKILLICKFDKNYEMSTEEIKSRLHEGIENIDDNEFLLALKELIERKYNSIESPELSEYQLERIKKSEIRN
jgi:hypothetical protein